MPETSYISRLTLLHVIIIQYVIYLTMTKVTECKRKLDESQARRSGTHSKLQNSKNRAVKETHRLMEVSIVYEWITHIIPVFEQDVFDKS